MVKTLVIQCKAFGPHGYQYYISSFRKEIHQEIKFGSTGDAKGFGGHYWYCVLECRVGAKFVGEEKQFGTLTGREEVYGKFPLFSLPMMYSPTPLYHSTQYVRCLKPQILLAQTEPPKNKKIPFSLIAAVISFLIFLVKFSLHLKL